MEMKFKDFRKQLRDKGVDVIPLINDRMNLLRRDVKLPTVINYECSYNRELYLGTFYNLKDNEEVKQKYIDKIYQLLNDYKKENPQEPKHIEHQTEELINVNSQ